MKPSPSVLAFGLAFVCIVGAIVLAALHDTIPVELWSAAFAALGAGAGISVPAPHEPAP